VGTGFRKKMRQNKKAGSFSDSIEFGKRSRHPIIEAARRAA
jgi:hypothetical protein